MEKQYGPIHTVNTSSWVREYWLEGCLRCGAAVPAHVTFREQHDKWHEHNEKRFTTIDANFTLIQDRLNKVWNKVEELVNWLNNFRRMNS